MSSAARFHDGAAYERMMGTWSRLAGEVFLDWLAPDPGLRWVDIGCGNGAFTELLVDQCKPAEVQAIDPSEAQIAFARARPAARVAHFQIGDAMALPFADKHFDAAAMALVIFFVPDPVKGVAEMVRVVRRGGIVAAYAWDMFDGGYPLASLQLEMNKMGVTRPPIPSAEASRMETLRKLWLDQGLEAVETREIKVQRTFADFDEFWSISTTANIGGAIRTMAPDDVEELKKRMRARMAADAGGHITYAAWANAIRGRVPAYAGSDLK